MSGLHPTLETNPLPVNMQAAKIFWKAPWWAKLPIEDKEQMVRTTTRIEDLVNVFQPPPKLPKGKHNQIQDRRGQKVKTENGVVALILGYAYSKSDDCYGRKIENHIWFNGHNWASASVKGISRKRPAHRWYAFFEGAVGIININSGKWKMAGNYEPITPPYSSEPGQDVSKLLQHDKNENSNHRNPVRCIDCTAD